MAPPKLIFFFKSKDLGPRFKKNVIGRGQRLFGLLPKKHQFWRCQTNIITVLKGFSSSECMMVFAERSCGYVEDKGGAKFALQTAGNRIFYASYVLPAVREPLYSLGL